MFGVEGVIVMNIVGMFVLINYVSVIVVVYYFIVFVWKKWYIGKFLDNYEYSKYLCVVWYLYK